MMRRRLAVGAATLGAVAVLGVPLGLLWWAIAPRPEVTAAGDGTTWPYPVSETMFASEGYFTLIMAVAGLVSGYGAYMTQYRLSARDGADLRLVCLLGVAAGAVLGSVIAWRVGVLLDAGAFHRRLADASPGDVIRAGLRLRALSALMAWPFVSVLQYALYDAVSMWRRDLPHQRSGEAEPGGADENAAPPMVGEVRSSSE